jgi:hypothetical protein
MKQPAVQVPSTWRFSFVTRDKTQIWNRWFRSRNDPLYRLCREPDVPQLVIQAIS